MFSNELRRRFIFFLDLRSERPKQFANLASLGRPGIFVDTPPKSPIEINLVRAERWPIGHTKPELASERVSKHARKLRLLICVRKSLKLSQCASTGRAVFFIVHDRSY